MSLSPKTNAVLDIVSETAFGLSVRLPTYIICGAGYGLYSTAQTLKGLFSSADKSKAASNDVGFWAGCAALTAAVAAVSQYVPQVSQYIAQSGLGGGLAKQAFAAVAGTGALAGALCSLKDSASLIANEVRVLRGQPIKPYETYFEKTVQQLYGAPEARKPSPNI